eukprot:TRINITY_DN2889_c0_g1_i2.p1 TRINITY_DN2889_c0_g1~~TRINITY_DN2889_c0_g1_i2.p1  ORF type:complete len:262 (-),score=65.18 TRINITY_DN2889_c0_g1_i2:398-1135(-)
MPQSFNLGATVSFVSSVFRRPSVLFPHLHASALATIRFDQLKAKGFQGIVLDKDNTITKPYAPNFFDERIEKAVRESQRVFGGDRVIVFSNSAGSSDDARKNYEDAKKLEESLGVRVLRHGTKKPNGIDNILSYYNSLQDPSTSVSSASSNDVQASGGVDASRLVLIGDRYATDIAFGNQHGMYTIKTPLLTNEGDPLIVKLIRPIESFIVNLLLKTRLSKDGGHFKPHPLIPTPQDQLKLIKQD